jgi:hypothetical protein
VSVVHVACTLSRTMRRWAMNNPNTRCCCRGLQNRMLTIRFFVPPHMSRKFEDEWCARLEKANL